MGVRKLGMANELFVNGGHGLSLELLIKWIDFKLTHCKCYRNITHAFLMLIFGTLLFPRSKGLIDVALADVILQVVRGKGYVVALLAKMITSLNRVKTHGRGVS